VAKFSSRCGGGIYDCLLIALSPFLPESDATGDDFELETFRILGDLPDRSANDPLGFDETARNLTAIVVSSRAAAPFTLGIEGGWGTGKSSLMARVEGNLRRDHPEVTTVLFNAWTAADGDALEGLIKSVLNRLDPSVLRRVARNKRLAGFGRIAARIVAARVGVSQIVDELWSQAAADPRARNDLKLLLEAEMTRWLDTPGGVPHDRLVAVFVDDLDRCSPTNVFQVFEAIKLYLSLPGLVFIVGYDKDVVSESILSREHYGPGVSKDDYLDKIIQVVYRVPTPPRDAAESLIDQYLGASGTSHLFDSALRSLVVERNARNPRRIKRFVNSFVTMYRLDPEWAEIGPAILVRVVILYMYFPEFAKLFSDPAHSDPVAAFFAYERAHRALRARTLDDDTRGLLESFGIRASAEGAADHDALIHELEEVAPDCFPLLLRKYEFVSVIDGLSDVAVRMSLIKKLEGTEFSVPGLPAEPIRGFEVQPLPVPTGEYPYTLKLEDVVSGEAIAEIADRGALCFHTVGDTGAPRNPQPQQAVARAVAGERPPTSFLYLLGDLVYYSGERERYHQQFYEPYADYPGPIFAIPGNHDGLVSDKTGEPSLAAFVDNFCAAEPEHRPEAGGVQRAAMTQPNVYWTLETPYVTIIGIYTNVPSSGDIDNNQIEWLTSQLSEAPYDRALVLAMHHPCISADAYHSGSTRIRNAVDEAMWRARRIPDLILAAHVNNYQRLTRKLGSETIHYLIVGAGGYHNLHRIAKAPDGTDPTVPSAVADDVMLEAYCDDRHGYLRLTATPTELRGEYFAVNREDAQPPEVRDAFVVPVSLGQFAD
jgi:acid phosphatase type 7